MPSRVQIIEAFWKAVPTDAGWAELSAGIQVVAEVAGTRFVVDTTADGPFKARPCDQYMLVLEQYAVEAAAVIFTGSEVAA